MFVIENVSDMLYVHITCSLGVQKEDMVGDDVFELDMDQNIVEPPKTPNLRTSA